VRGVRGLVTRSGLGDWVIGRTGFAGILCPGIKVREGSEAEDFVDFTDDNAVFAFAEFAADVQLGQGRAGRSVTQGFTSMQIPTSHEMDSQTVRVGSMKAAAP
jgi:hypothetical protein